MKKILILFVIMLFVGSCTKIADNFDSPVEFNLGISQSTRAGDDAFEIEDAVGLYNYSQASEILYSNVLFTNTESGFKNFEQIYYGSSQAVNFLGYYPYKVDMEWRPDAVTDWSVEQNQWIDRNYTNGDLMVANTQNVVSGTKSVSLNFNHLMSKIEINIIPALGYDAQELVGNVDVKIMNVKRSCKVNFLTSQISDLHNAGSIEPTKDQVVVDGVIRGVWAIVVPQVVAGGNLLIEVVIRGVKYTYTPLSDFTFFQGKKTAFNLTVSDRRVEFSSEITNWEEGGQITGDVTLETPTVKDIEDNEYSVVDVGGKKWLGSNLKTKTLNDGTAIKLASRTDFMGKVAIFHSLSTIDGEDYILYSHLTATSSKICPAGWHVPSAKEMDGFKKVVGATAGLKTKSTNGWNDGTEEKAEYQGDGSTQFNALAVGYVDADSYGTLKGQKNTSIIWVTDFFGSYASGYAWAHNSEDIVFGNKYNRNNCMAIRCVQN